LEDLFHILVPSGSVPLSFGCEAFTCRAGTINTGAPDGIKSEQMCCFDSCATWSSANDCNAFSSEPAMIMYDAGGTIAQTGAQTCCIPDQAQVELVIVIMATVSTALILCSGGFLGFQSLDQVHPEKAPTTEEVVARLLDIRDDAEQTGLGITRTDSAQVRISQKANLEKAYN
jgi:hypothetical protein